MAEMLLNRRTALGRRFFTMLYEEMISEAGEALVRKHLSTVTAELVKGAEGDLLRTSTNLTRIEKILVDASIVR